MKERRKKYLIFGTGVVFAGITYIIVRGVVPQSISRDVIVTASRDVIVARKKIEMNNVSFISSHRQGSPSWVIRCLETNAVFTSQRAASLAMDISESNISRHLNGLQDHAQGYTFERLCIAA